MSLPSVKLLLAAVVGATLMAYRGYETAPDSSAMQVEMAGWVLYGAVAIAVGVLWELLRAGVRLNERCSKKGEANG